MTLLGAHFSTALAGSGAPALSTSNFSTKGGILFEARSDGDSLEGDLLAREVDKFGNVTADEYYPYLPEEPGYVSGKEGEVRKFNGLWRASIRVTAQAQRADQNDIDDRIIFTSGVDSLGNVQGRRFRWDNVAGDALTDAMKAWVNSDGDPGDSTDPVVGWTRGNDTHEGVGPEYLRQRITVLGNLTNSGPVYVGPPTGSASGPGYHEYSNTNRVRLPIVIAGGSDGMLHAFRADNGNELFAYIPAGVLGKLRDRTRQNYRDKSLVGGPVVAGDAYGNFPQCTTAPCWRTLLTGSLGSGGSSVFALDITNPHLAMGNTDREANAAQKLFLWEFRHERLGLTSSRPLIARLADGNSIVVFGNGPGEGESLLFVLEAATGKLLYEIEVSSGGVGGLSSPAGWDEDYDGNLELIYAGGPDGNLWKFDLSLASEVREGEETPDTLSGRSVITVIGSRPGEAQSIYSPPVVTVRSDGKLMIFFEARSAEGDSSSIYGVVDENTNWGANAPLISRTLGAIEYSGAPQGFRPVLLRVINSISVPDNPVGWRLNLPAGETLVGNLMLNNGRIEFISSTKKSPHYIENWFTGVDYLTGGAPVSPMVDINSDGVLNQDDTLVDANNDGEFTVGDDLIPAGRFLGTGKISAPTTAIIAGDRAAVFFSREPMHENLEHMHDPGVVGGGFDESNFDWSPGQFSQCETQQADGEGSVCVNTMSCWGGLDSTGVCHTSRYDDVWNIDGVNLLAEGGVLAHPPDVESATGILSNRQKALFQAISMEQEGRAGSGLRQYAASVSDEIRLWIVNPNSVDNRALADLRIASGVDPEGTEPAPPPDIYFNCDRNGDGLGDTRIVIDAPGFNLLPDSLRTCVIEEIVELKVRHHNINALRATDPVCAEAHNTSVPPGSLGAPGAPHPNTGYRNGVFTVQAITTGRRQLPGGGNEMISSTMKSGVVIWENANYEHFGDGCAVLNEALRGEKGPSQNPTDDPTENPSDDGGVEDPDNPAPVVEAGDETTPTKVDVSSSYPPDGRVSWREVVE
jgi:hypothetical protein